MREHKIITCTGYGATGSSVITDLLKEFKTVHSLGDFEFSIAHEVDGISDLQHYIVDDFHRNKVTEGIYRFKKLVRNLNKYYAPFFHDKFLLYADEYVDSLIDVKWNGFWHQHLIRCSPLVRYTKYSLPNLLQIYVNKYFRKNTGYEFVPKMRTQEMCVSYGAGKFFEQTKRFYNLLFDAVDVKGEYEYLALDQLVPSYNYERYLKYFSNIKVIVIDRDPRDLYLLNKLYWHDGWIPSEDINTFIKWFSLIRRHQICEKSSLSQVLKIRFEDCVFKYEETLQQILTFLEMPQELHIRQREFFNPDVSKKNVALWKKHPQYDADIKLIEEQLSEFCYGFS